jgi:hypothetical protein
VRPDGAVADGVHVRDAAVLPEGRAAQLRLEVRVRDFGAVGVLDRHGGALVDPALGEGLVVEDERDGRRVGDAAEGVGEEPRLGRAGVDVDAARDEGPGD